MEENKIILVVEDEEKMNRREIFGFDLKDVRQVGELQPDAVLITSLLDQTERIEKLKKIVDGERVRVWSIPSI